MRTQEILHELRTQGFAGKNWSTKEKAEWVFSNFKCSKYVAKQVSYLI